MPNKKRLYFAHLSNNLILKFNTFLFRNGISIRRKKNASINIKLKTEEKKITKSKKKNRKVSERNHAFKDQDSHIKGQLSVNSIRKERAAMTWDEISEWRRTWKPSPTKPAR